MSSDHWPGQDPVIDADVNHPRLGPQIHEAARGGRGLVPVPIPVDEHCEKAAGDDS